ncbi:MAG: glycosyltransferase family 2 protein, partial [Vulcanisaeta sp.]|nr:glycosyltransferase family 2 protein [Vulcanisaeta sp.]
MSTDALVNTEIKELIRQVVQQYVMNQYPWGLITRPLTPVSKVVLLITYVITIVMLTLSLLQIIVLVRYGVNSLAYLKKARLGNDDYNPPSTGRLPLVSILIPIKGESIQTIERSLQNLARLNYPR